MKGVYNNCFNLRPDKCLITDEDPERNKSKQSKKWLPLEIIYTEVKGHHELYSSRNVRNLHSIFVACRNLSVYLNNLICIDSRKQTTNISTQGLR